MITNDRDVAYIVAYQEYGHPVTLTTYLYQVLTPRRGLRFFTISADNQTWLSDQDAENFVQCGVLLPN